MASTVSSGVRGREAGEMGAKPGQGLADRRLADPKNMRGLGQAAHLEQKVKHLQVTQADVVFHRLIP
jgi:hypothetical protein